MFLYCVFQHVVPATQAFRHFGVFLQIGTNCAVLRPCCRSTGTGFEQRPQIRRFLRYIDCVCCRLRFCVSYDAGKWNIASGSENFKEIMLECIIPTKTPNIMSPGGTALYLCGSWLFRDQSLNLCFSKIPLRDRILYLLIMI